MLIILGLALRRAQNLKDSLGRDCCLHVYYGPGQRTQIEHKMPANREP